jgi:ribosome-associated toxin RatA of RatAB toxin-antitoxin module
VSRCGRAAPAVLLLCWSAAARAADPLLSHAEIRSVERGEVVTRYFRLPGTSVGSGVAVGVIDARPEQVFKIIADVERYKDYIDRVVESRITRRDGERYLFYYRIDMPWPLADQWFVTSNVHVVDEQRHSYRRSWTLHEGTFARNDGYWLVRPWRSAALVVYSAVLQPKGVIPQFVINYVTRRSLPRAISNLRRRVDDLRQRGTL